MPLHFFSNNRHKQLRVLRTVVPPSNNYCCGFFTRFIYKQVVKFLFFLVCTSRRTFLAKRGLQTKPRKLVCGAILCGLLSRRSPCAGHLATRVPRVGLTLSLYLISFSHFLIFTCSLRSPPRLLAPPRRRHDGEGDEEPRARWRQALTLGVRGCSSPMTKKKSRGDWA